MFAGEKVPEYEEVFTGTKTEETQYADNTYVKELFLDYAGEWNKRRRKQGGENSCQKSIEQK